MKRKHRVLLVLGLAAVILAGLAIKKYRGADSAANRIQLSGTIEITDAALGFRLGGRVRERLVSEGQSVAAGQPLALLDDRDLQHEKVLRQAALMAASAALAELEAGSRPEEIATAEAAVAQARAALAELEAGSRPEEIKAAGAAVQQAAALTERWRAEYARQRQLLDRKVIAPREFEQVTSQFQSAREQQQQAAEQLALVEAGPRPERIDQARAALNQAEARLALIRQGPRRQTIDQARARQEEAQAALALAETRIGYATLTSPTAGTVLAEHAEAGEYLAAGAPVVTIGDLSHVWLRAYIDETDLGRVHLGQAVQVWSDTSPDKPYPGTVSFIAPEAEFTPKTVQTAKERVKLVYRIKVAVANPDRQLKPGMPVDGAIALGE